MNSEGKFWFSLWSLAAVAAIAIAVTIGSVTIHSDRVILRMVEDGANPIAAKCAMSDSIGNNPTCVALVTK